MSKCLKNILKLGIPKNNKNKLIMSETFNNYM